jgi:ATP-dependent RNA helicase DDX54/DBP10
MDGQDVVGMARTGSGKTAAFVIPMIEKLKAHSAKVGARSLVLSPSRELALQTLKVIKEMGKGTDLKCVLLVGGDSLEEQFGMMAANPDIIIATPGRFLHLKVEMSLDLSSIRYVVFDEADRLFEMGFAAQLAEILHALPPNRQSLLFSATLPKSLVEFARAGLQEPSLVRLDAESKMSADLESVFFSIKSAEKEGALLHIVQDVLKIPAGLPEAAKRANEGTAGKKRKRPTGGVNPSVESPTEHSTIIFVATKHHVDYVVLLLRIAGFAVSYAYGALDQTARRTQVQDFRAGLTNILVVTDVAARGIDIPILANVVNYDFPAQPKIFIHRVGRTARAGRRGWSYSLVTENDSPYLLDLQLFLSRELVVGAGADKEPDFANTVVVGGLARDRLANSCEWVGKLLEEDIDLHSLQQVSVKGEKLYMRTRNSASTESVKRSKDLTASKDWMALNPLFKDEVDELEGARLAMLARVSGFRPNETVFEIGKRGAGRDAAAEMMRQRREKIVPTGRKDVSKGAVRLFDVGKKPQHDDMEEDSDSEVEVEVEGGGANKADPEVDMESASETELEITFSQPTKKSKGKDGSFKDSEHFMAYTPANNSVVEERGYGVHSGSYNTASQNSNFVEAARGVTMDLTNEEGGKAFGLPSQAKGMRWDKKGSKYVSRVNDEDGSKGAKMIRGESGQKIAASFKSGRFDRWKKSHKVDRLPRVGEIENPQTASRNSASQGRRFAHKQEKAPKEADRFRDDYHVRKKRVQEAKENRVGRFRDGEGKGEIKSANDVRKARQLQEKKKAKNARPSKKGGRR